MTGDDILENPFHACAFQAHLEIWLETGQWPPDSELTRRRADELYEALLKAKPANRGTG